MDEELDINDYLPDADVEAIEEPDEMAAIRQRIMATENVAEVIEADTLREIERDLKRKWDDYSGDLKDEHAVLRAIEDLFYKLPSPDAAPKLKPWKGASDVNMPVIQEAVLNFYADFCETFCTLEKYTKGKIDKEIETALIRQQNPGGEAEKIIEQMRLEVKAEQELADRKADFIDYQLRDVMPAWVDELNTMGVLLPLLGTVFKKCNYDAIHRRPKHELIKPYDLIFNTTAKNERDASFMGLIQKLQRKEIDENIAKGIFVEYREGLDEEEEDIDYEKITEFYEIYTYLDLDDDGYPEPYQVWIDTEYNKVAMIQKCFGMDDIIQRQDGTIIIEPRLYFVRYVMLPRSKGCMMLGTGLGHLLYYTNVSANTLINQVIDAATKANMGGGFQSDQLNIVGGTYSFIPGQFAKVKATNEELQKGFFPLPVQQPNTVLVQLLEVLIAQSNKIGSLMISPESMPANTPAATTMAMVDQGAKKYKAIFSVFCKSMQREIEILIKNNVLYLDDAEYVKRVKEAQGNEFRLEEKGKVSVNVNLDAINRMQRMAQVQFMDTFRQDPTIDQLYLKENMFEMMGVENAELYIVAPVEPDPDPKQIELQQRQAEAAVRQIEANNYLMEAQGDKLMVEAGLKPREVDIKAADSQSKHMVNAATAAEKIANAEAKEEGIQIEKYRAETKSMKEENSGKE